MFDILNRDLCSYIKEKKIRQHICIKPAKINHQLQVSAQITVSGQCKHLIMQVRTLKHVLLIMNHTINMYPLNSYLF